MTRAINTPQTHKRRKKILAEAKGFFDTKHKTFKAAKEQVLRSWARAYVGRKQKKRDARSLWIIRINNFLRQQNCTYSRFMHLIKLSHIPLDRKQLSNMAIYRPDTFKTLMSQVLKPVEEQFVS